MKHETGFTLIPSSDPDDPPGTLYWRTPTGRQYPSYPTQLAPPAETDGDKSSVNR